MASHGIKDRVAIVGMGCTPFREHWDKGVDDLSLEASNEAFAAAGIIEVPEPLNMSMPTIVATKSSTRANCASPTQP